MSVKRTNKNELGFRIAIIREKRGLSRDSLAKKIGSHLNSIKQIELGNNKPSLKMLEDICRGLDIEPYILFYLISNARKTPPVEVEKNMQMYMFNASFMQHLKSVYDIDNTNI
jgi:transcriptional regulator with XRE-family HTH domain